MQYGKCCINLNAITWYNRIKYTFLVICEIMEIAKKCIKPYNFFILINIFILSVAYQWYVRIHNMLIRHSHSF